MTDVLVPGKPAPAQQSAVDAPHDDAAIPLLTDVVAPGKPAPAAVAEPGVSPVAAAVPAAAEPGAAPVTAAVPEEVEADPDTVIVEPVPTPHVPAVEWPPLAAVADAQAPAVSAASAALTAEDAQHIAERLRDRLTNYLTGEGREAIEARCRDALHDHTAWLVSQITREVALALETEVMEWVRDAVDTEIARRSAGHPG
nr:DUF2486 family protein [Burkholderia sp. Ac-20353]